jgi:hypothetical protein
MNLIKLAVNTSMLVAFAVCFIGIFFFTYAKDIEKDIVVNNVRYLIDTLTPNLKLLPQPVYNILKNNVNNIKLANMDKEDAEVTNANNELLKKSAKVLGIVLVLSLAFSYYMCNKYNLDFNDLLYHNLILVGCVALVEFMFLNLIAKNYISADPNIIARNLTSQL